MVADILGLGLDLRLRPRPVLGLPFFYKALDSCLGAWPACFQPLLLLDTGKFPNENEQSNLEVMPLKGRGLSPLPFPPRFSILGEGGRRLGLKAIDLYVFVPAPEAAPAARAGAAAAAAAGGVASRLP